MVELATLLKSILTTRMHDDWKAVVALDVRSVTAVVDKLLRRPHCPHCERLNTNPPADTKYLSDGSIAKEASLEVHCELRARSRQCQGRSALGANIREKLPESNQQSRHGSGAGGSSTVSP